MTEQDIREALETAKLPPPLDAGQRGFLTPFMLDALVPVVQRLLAEAQPPCQCQARLRAAAQQIRDLVERNPSGSSEFAKLRATTYEDAANLLPPAPPPERSEP